MLFDAVEVSPRRGGDNDRAEAAPTLSRLDLVRRHRQRSLGKYGLLAEQLAMKKSDVKREQYSVSLISAISQDRVIASQLIQGGVDSTVFESFLQAMLLSLRTDKSYDDKNIVLYLDNAAIHSHSNVLETARRMQVNVLFSAPYSPWLNPIEHLFDYLKRRTREETVNSR